MKIRVAPFLIAATLLAAVPAAADASRVVMGGDFDANVLYAGADGEANKVEVSVSGTTATIDDPGAGSIEAVGPECVSVNPKRAVCTSAPDNPIDFVTVQTGDGDDTVEVNGAPGARLEGGTGSDRLTGTDAGTDIFEGGGGPGDDMRGRGGDDFMLDSDSPAAPDADAFDGGAGIDTLSYGGRTAPVTVDLRADGTGGGAGENDQIRGIENARGGSAGDTLTGGAGPSGLGGDAGNDTIDGGLGDDIVTTGTGDDTAIGGPGRDELHTEEGNDVLRLDNPTAPFDRVVSCGDGRDRVVGVVPSPSLPVTCELGDFGSGWLARLMPVDIGTSSVIVKLPCPAAFRRNGVCKGTLAAEPKGAYLRDAATRRAQRYGLRAFRLTGSGRVRVPLDADGRRQLRKSAFKLQFEIRIKDASGATRVLTWTDHIVRRFFDR